jgi:D-glycero-beta-D-manno-heptose 1-phosphate adenylyltransferase
VTPSFEAKICEPGKLAARAGDLARALVFTNGVFDIVHRGHVTYLAEARALGQSLVVALNSDASARRLGKGDDRPINTLEDRLAVVAALESVSLVTWFDEDTPLERIIACRPDHLVKGGDWTVDRIVGAKEVASWGGSVRSIPFRHDRSTTKILSRIRQ